MDIHLYLRLLYLQDQGLPQVHSKMGLGSERAPGECDLNEMKVKTEHDSVNMRHTVILPLWMKQSRPRENISAHRQQSTDRQKHLGKQKQAHSPLSLSLRWSLSSNALW